MAIALPIEAAPLIVLFPQQCPPEVDPEDWRCLVKRRALLIEARHLLEAPGLKPREQGKGCDLLIELENREQKWIEDHDELMDLVIGDECATA